MTMCSRRFRRLISRFAAILSSIVIDERSRSSIRRHVRAIQISFFNRIAYILVVRLDYPFDTLNKPPTGVHREEFERLFRQSRAYIIGTAHFSLESQNDVRRAIAETQPDLILVELCPSRMAILSLDEEMLLREARSLNREKVSALIKEHGLV